MVPVKKYYNSNHGNIMSLLNNFLGGNILNTIFSNNVSVIWKKQNILVSFSNLW